MSAPIEPEVVGVSENQALDSYTPKPMTTALTETAGQALAAQAEALVKARYAIALRQPRDIDVVRTRILRECQRPQFCEHARYEIKRGGKPITGPSIRFAEAILREMGNVLIETPTVYDDPEKRIVRVSVSDIQANISYSLDVTIRKAVERKHPAKGDDVLRARQNSRGETVYLIAANEGDLAVAQGAAISKAIRTLGLRLVPGWLIDECMDRVVATLQAADAKDPDAAKRKLFDAFAQMGVTPQALKAYIGNEADVLAPAELTELRGIYAALKEGTLTWDQVTAEDAEVAPATGAPADQTAAPARGARGLKRRLRRAAGPGGTGAAPPVAEPPSGAPSAPSSAPPAPSQTPTVAKPADDVPGWGGPSQDDGQ